ncbi:DUF4922 domain-containing protein [Accumulibacter sp.]|uniref:DUF4922 domain-containing protein n=1 Tax=Accumulibacter sp. TaxID=2053492 RepID=UPI0025F4B682|nr:DUF4922 domain-containing protein [Accumulibacter sp.]MCM8595654.1 DUF4922 domain-containing protein [Accumulibacter sp.]MCM8626002.1 DUF4922 domain-containing protein [Accumulibacter sp.]MDS4049801.1 DUF4922 domain-containing protein [Accumulibacter sp.]
MNERPCHPTGSRFDPAEFNRDNYERVSAGLNDALRRIENDHGLPAALEVLEAQQLDVGFIQDDLSQVQRYRLIHPSDPGHVFTAQFNPRRTLRHAGAGRSSPPKGSTAENGGCFLCRENVRWQQRGIEVGYDLRVGERDYIAWMNPFPLMPMHVTIARRDHEPQTWVRDSPGASSQTIRQILDDLLDLTSRLPGFVGFYNGEGAGATIPGHFHFQFFKRPEGQEFALERTASIAAAEVHRHLPLVIRKYPIKAICFSGRRADIVLQANRWIDQWTSHYESSRALSANMIAQRAPQDGDSFHLFFVPRNRLYSHAPGIAGLVGGLEVLGEMVFSTDEEKARLVSGQIDYHSVVRILASVEAPGVSEFLDTIQP